MSEVWIMISAGSGPKECSWVADRLASAFEREAVEAGLKVQIIGQELEGGALARSLLLQVKGGATVTFTASVVGSVRWIGASPFRPSHKRKNWFVGVSLLPAPEEMHDLKDADIRYQAMKASGPGGQHVNSTDSAVRAVHGPTGITVVAKEERSQHANKRLAKVKIAAIMQEHKDGAVAEGKGNQWRVHHSLERGNAVRTYEGVKFKRKAG
jgi:peptide chain release factor